MKTFLINIGVYCLNFECETMEQAEEMLENTSIDTRGAHVAGELVLSVDVPDNPATISWAPNQKCGCGKPVELLIAVVSRVSTNRCWICADCFDMEYPQRPKILLDTRK